MLKKLKKEKIDLVIVLLFPVVASIISLSLKVNYFWAIILFLGLPSIYLSVRAPRFIKKTALFSILASFPAIIVIDYIGQKTNQWVIPSSISSFRILNITQIEQILWAFFNFYAVVIFYKYFLDKHYSKRAWGKHLGAVAIIGLFLMGPFLFFLWSNPSLLNIPYFYFVFGLSLIGVPAIAEPLGHPNLATKFLKTAAYFFFLSLCFELTALMLDCCWRFPSREFIGWLEIFSIRFPLEELIFWIMLFALAILAIYEKFDENER